jgi:hypothetical protein
MVSKVEICNKALTLLSANLIMAFEPTESTEAALCVVNYDSARRYAIEKRAWTFATKRVVLSSPLSTAPEWGYGYAFIKPNDSLRILIVSDDPDFKDGGSPMDYRLEGNNIVANIASVYVKYLFDEIQETSFSPSFVEAISHYLAYLMATPLTESKSLKSEILKEFKNLTDEAAATDGLQGSSDRIKSNRLLRVRAITGRNFGGRA